MTLQVLLKDYTGLTNEPAGTVAVSAARVTTGMWWWKATTIAWAVQQVQRKFSDHGYILEWHTIGVYAHKDDADILAKRVGQGGFT